MSRTVEIQDEIATELANRQRARAAGAGKAYDPMVSVVDHDVPTDLKKLRALRLKQADAAISAAAEKVKTLKQFVATAPRGHKEKQRAHLKGAEQALAEAIAAKERIV